jgi:ribonuclease HII
MAKFKYKIGIDEVGRGPLAGPITVAAFLMPINGKLFSKKLPRLRDSKKMVKSARLQWAKYLKTRQNYSFAIASLSAKTIDKLNISNSANLCAEKVIYKLGQKMQEKNILKKSKVYLDGGLYVGDKRKKIGKTIIKGDEKIKVISAASILAKVHRDNLMSKYALKFKPFGFEGNKGYGTKKHILALKNFGPTIIHRKTFIKNFI